ncbi:hypothetical protein D9619_004606 [Psilocybe cf. subviscida]|uniref:F-box domain-containing protein n=1 Tax=Psilocybe cf. subviscida TaxID=2480587 RepID=A0A8H5F8A7_9AGAR|nr:hypothetical protein D9619_004606 [Psilocybe cf. subviscida]
MAFQIPTEVLLQIVKHQSANDDLRYASLTCKALRDDAQQILFRTPVPRTAYHHLIFLDAILSSPDRLGPMVREYVHVSGSAYCDGEDEVLIEKTGRMLRAMCNLKRLAFRNAKKLPASVLDNTTFQLDAFDWGSSHDNSDILHWFLLTQPGLKHLTYHGKWAPDDVESLCPRLRSVTGGMAAVQLFVTGKRVTHLQWTPQDRNEDFAAAPYLESKLKRVRFLTCRATREGLPWFASQLRSLVLLEMSGLGLGFDYNELRIGLENIWTLEVLILVDYVPPTQAPADPLYINKVARDIFSWCLYLEHIDISCSSSTDEHQQFRRFHRAGTLKGIDREGVMVEEATVYAWILSKFEGEAIRMPAVVKREVEPDWWLVGSR